MASTGSGDVEAKAASGMVLPFDPLALSFHDLNYYVPLPPASIRDRKRHILLAQIMNSVSRLYAYPGQVICSRSRAHGSSSRTVIFHVVMMGECIARR